MNTSLGCVLTNTGSHDPSDVAISFKIYRNVGVGDGKGVGEELRHHCMCLETVIDYVTFILLVNRVKKLYVFQPSSSSFSLFPNLATERYIVRYICFCSFARAPVCIFHLLHVQLVKNSVQR